MINIGIMMTFAGFLCFIKYYNSIFNLMLTMEFLMITLLMLTMNSVMMGYVSPWSFMIFLLLMVCEGSMSLGLLVAISRYHGSMMIHSLNLMKW